jgi:uncharacterized protein YcbK (DUF882 family)
MSPRRATVVRLALLLLACGTAARQASGEPPRAAHPGASPRRPSGPVPASRGWHLAPAGRPAPVDGRGRALLVLQGLNIPDRIELQPRSERGGFSAEDLDRAAHIMRDASGNEHPVEPRLLDLVYRLQAHFKAPEIRIISGYRAPRGGATSNHGKGRAMDLVVPGATDEDVARFARDEGFAGVGIYPVSGFVHVDVRERSYFWVDTSGPGKRSRVRGVLAELAARSDAAAAARGERSVGPFHLETDVDTALARSALAARARSSPPEEEDETDGPAPP